MDEEVWNNLTLTSLFPHVTIPITASSNPPGSSLVFQDFMACTNTSNLNDDTSKNVSAETDRSHDQQKKSTSMCPCPGRKRVPVNEEDVIDRKRKRLMKNRESAARSRARRQAYTYELEAEVAHLMEENAILRKQVEKFRFAAVNGGDDPQPKRQRIYRTVSGPF